MKKGDNMIVEGYRYGADFINAAKSIAKHTNISLAEATKLCEKLQKEGLAFSLPNDFVLLEELKHYRFTVS
jgi:hypothetical protein